jgi:predicted DNA-binding ArsR family transcriptional regulator
VHDDKSGNSEEVALKEVIKASQLESDDIVVFDRGLSSRKTFTEFSDTEINFVTRLSDKANYKIIRNLNEVKNHETETLYLLEDNVVNPEQFKRENFLF